MSELRCSARAMARCPDKYLCGASAEGGVYAENSECHRFNEQVAQTTLTHADRIRIMSDKELAAFLARIKTECFICAKEGCDRVPYDGVSCTEGIFEFLSRPHRLI